jgi:dolichol-phosphate mannosyltransferase
MCGLRSLNERAERIIVMDGDLQDRPEDIPQLLSALSGGFDCAFAERRPASKSILIDKLTGVFYRLQELTVPFPVPRYAGTFCALRKEFLRHVCRFSEADLYFPGIRAYVGFKQAAVLVQRDCRRHGTSKVGLIGLLRLSSSGILGFSALPLRMIFLCGLAMFAPSVAIGILVLALRLTGIIEVMGFTSLMLILLAFGGIQMMSLGILGEYLSKLFTDVKRRPEVIIGSTIKGSTHDG